MYFVELANAVDCNDNQFILTEQCPNFLLGARAVYFPFEDYYCLDLNLLWHRMSRGTIFLLAFEKCLLRQPYCLLGSGLVRPKISSSLG